MVIFAQRNAAHLVRATVLTVVAVGVEMNATLDAALYAQWIVEQFGSGKNSHK